jgi:hypothetical protein
LVIVVVVLCVVISGVVAGVLFARYRPAAQLRSARGTPAAARLVAAASAALTAADAAADRFGLITTELLAFPAPSSAPACADEQLTDVAGALARLEHAADQVAQAGTALAALAALAAAGQGCGTRHGHCRRREARAGHTDRGGAARGPACRGKRRTAVRP